MANTHSFVNTAFCTAMSTDNYNVTGINTTTDFDNGVLVSLGAMQIANSTTPGGFEYAVTAPVANATGLWVIDTPEALMPIEMQYYDDPRYFYNIAGRPMQLRYVNPVVDILEYPALAFTSGFDPDTVGATAKYVSVETTGKLKAVASAPANGTYFEILGTHFIDIGTERVKTWLIKCVRN